MGNQMPELEKLLDEWQEKHAKLLSQEAPYFLDHEPPFGRFVRDGVVNLDEWKKQKLRVCFLMPEASGFDNLELYPEGTICDVAQIWNEKGSFTRLMQMVAFWTQAVYDATQPPIAYRKKQINKKQNDLIRSVAVVNIKKSDGTIQPKITTLRNFARADAAEIRKELEIIKANIIICSGTYPVIHGERPEEPEETRSFVFYDDELIPGAQRTYKWGKNKLVIHAWPVAQKFQPANSKCMNYYAIREIVRAGIKSFQDPPPPAPKKKKAKAKPAETAATETKE